MGGKQNNPKEIRGYSELLKRNSEHFDQIKQYAKDKGADTTGFQCGLLAALIPIAEGIGSFYEGTLDTGKSKLAKVAESAEESAEGYEKSRDRNIAMINQIDTGGKGGA